MFAKQSVYMLQIRVSMYGYAKRSYQDNAELRI